MPSTSDLRSRLRTARQRLREAEVAMLEERRKERELEAAYGEVSTVRPETLPRNYLQTRGQ